MIFVDANVFMYAVGKDHPHKQDAQRFFRDSVASDAALATSAEVLQELLHAYGAVGRYEALDEAFTLVHDLTSIWAIEFDDLDAARTLARHNTALSARDLVHLACCRRRKATGLKTYDKGLAAAWAA